MKLLNYASKIKNKTKVDYHPGDKKVFRMLGQNFYMDADIGNVERLLAKPLNQERISPKVVRRRAKAVSCST